MVSTGASFENILRQIAEQMRAKTVLLDKAGLAGVLVAKGSAEIVIQPMQELVVVPRNRGGWPTPRRTARHGHLSSGVMPNAKDVESLNALINYLRTPEAIAVIRAMGMEPG